MGGCRVETRMFHILSFVCKVDLVQTSQQYFYISRRPQPDPGPLINQLYFPAPTKTSDASQM